MIYYLLNDLAKCLFQSGGVTAFQLDVLIPGMQFYYIYVINKEIKKTSQVRPLNTY